jgi:hypothetical protein
MESLTLEQAYYIGELFGLAAVVTSLVFLTIQVRQNTRAIRGQSIATATGINQDELQYMMDPEYAATFLKSINSPESLTDNDLVVLDAWNTMFLFGRENDFIQNRLGTLDDELWVRSSGGISAVYSSAWGRHWWNTVGKELISSEFRLYVEKVLEKPAFSMNEYFEKLKI